MSCGLGTCVDPLCYLCTVVAMLPQPTWRAPEPDVLLDVAPETDIFGLEAQQAADYAEPDAGRKPVAQHPSQKKRSRKALEPPGLRRVRA